MSRKVAPIGLLSHQHPTATRPSRRAIHWWSESAWPCGKRGASSIACRAELDSPRFWHAGPPSDVRGLKYLSPLIPGSLQLAIGITGIKAEVEGKGGWCALKLVGPKRLALLMMLHPIHDLGPPAKRALFIMYLQECLTIE